MALVGAGPGDGGLLTVRGAELLGQAGLVVAAAGLAAIARRHMSPGARLEDPADGATAGALVQAARDGQLAVRLYDGDPLLSGGAAADAAACAEAGVRFEIVPGVPKATAVPAYAGIPLAEPNGELRVIHAAEISRVAYSPATLVVLGADAGPAELGKMLVAAGWPEATPFAITWGGTTSAQQTVVSTLGRVGPDLKAAGVSLANTRGPAIAVVGEAVAARDRLSWFETKPLFGWRVLVPRTKE
ncbi:MAG TPA: SAM-dependent methyltransferase, partial [Streptosporangiaceae bacterium]|nr:SAM-dependent methyltransferase [Streptosporangiaceae bacterium]